MSQGFVSTQIVPLPLGVTSGGTGVTTSTGSGSVVLNTSPTLTTPKIGQINDITNNTPSVGLVAPAGGVNYITLSGQTTGLAPELQASGSDTNIGMNLRAKGTGGFALTSEAATQPLTIFNGTGSQHSTNFSFPNTAASQTVTFPDETGTVMLAGSTFYVNTANTTVTSLSVVKYSNVVNDSASAYSTGTGLYTIPKTGWYMVNANIKTTSYNFGSGAIIQMNVYQNSTIIAQQLITPSAYNATSLALNAGTVYKFTGGDTVSVQAFSNLGGASTTLDNSVTNFLSINFLHS